MLDVDASDTTYQLKVKQQVRDYDPILLFQQLKDLEGTTDLTQIAEKVKKIFDLPTTITTVQALIVLQDFVSYADTILKPALKKVLGETPCSPEFSDSQPMGSPHVSAQDTKPMPLP